MRVLFITTHPPFPPIDGVRIPAANHLLALREKHQVDCLLLKCETMPYSPADVDATRQEVGECYEVCMSPLGTKRSILREFFKREPFYGRWILSEALPSLLVENDYDLIWCGTAPAVAIMAKPEMRTQLRAMHYVAGLSDIHSLVISSGAKQAEKSNSLVFRYIKNPLLNFRSRFLKRAEAKMLGQYDLCTMQTAREEEWVCSMGEGLGARSLVLPNGVNQELFDLPVERSEQQIFFVGLLNGIYRERVQWFFRKAWPLVHQRFPNAKATVIGKGATPEQLDFFEDIGVAYIPFVESLEDIYRERTIMIAPIFKGYGIINKVLEAMAAGCLVVGDRTAFNGIDGFEDGAHGLVAENAEEFADRVCRCLKSSDLLEPIRIKGRSLVREHFGWSKRYKMLQDRVRKLS
tara:strand:- start:2832 stop:4049 length:1218 start_codon:yes stop_codon:yes gene_type:complete